MRRALLAVLVTLAALSLAGCATSDAAETERRGVPHVVYSAAPTLDGPAPLTAREIVSELSFLLPLPNYRDNTSSACGCAQLITTDPVSVYQWHTEEDATQFSDSWVGPGEPDELRADRAGVFVLLYHRDTPVSEELRGQFRDRLIELVEERG